MIQGSHFTVVFMLTCAIPATSYIVFLKVFLPARDAWVWRLFRHLQSRVLHHDRTQQDPENERGNNRKLEASWRVHCADCFATLHPT